MEPKKVKDIMTPYPEQIAADATIAEAAKKMKDQDCGFLPIGGEIDKPIGVITDRDIVVYAIAEGKSPEITKVEEVMSTEVFVCSQEDDLKKAADEMSSQGVRRLVVTSEEGGDIVGILSVADIVSNIGGDDHVSDEIIHHLYRFA
jgi:CBS domain-containing protein